MTRFATNFCLDIPAKGYFFILPKELHSASEETLGSVTFNLAKKCHIYMIVRQPKYTFIPESLEFISFTSTPAGKVAHLNFTISYKVSGVLNEYNFENYGILVPEECESIEISLYPHHNLLAKDSQNDSLKYYPALQIAHERNNHLEILYIGQAFGNEQGSRTTLDRLKNHSTLQKILAITQDDFPDDQILIGSFEFDRARFLSSMDGMDKTAIFDESDSRRFHKTLNMDIKLREEIFLIEAALVRYFQPQYNITLKDSLPKPNSKTMRKCFDYDFTALSVNIFTDEKPANFYLYTQTVPPKDIHLAIFELANPQLRKTFFSIGTDMGTPDYVQNDYL